MQQNTDPTSKGLLVDSLRAVFDNPEILPNAGHLTIDLAAYDRIVARARELVIKKNQDYSGGRKADNILMGGLYGTSIRLLDKVSRLMTLTEPGAKAAAVKEESVIDTFADILNYSVIGQMLIEGSWGSAQPRQQGGIQESVIRLLLVCQALHRYAKEYQVTPLLEFLDGLEDHFENFHALLPQSVLDRSKKAEQYLQGAVDLLMLKARESAVVASDPRN